MLTRGSLPRLLITVWYLRDYARRPEADAPAGAANRAAGSDLTPPTLNRPATAAWWAPPLNRLDHP